MEGVPANTDIRLHQWFKSGENYDFDCDWGDGNTEHFDSTTALTAKHRYATAGNYTIKLSGVVDFLTYNSSSSMTYALRSYLVGVDVENSSPLKNFDRPFQYCKKLRTISGKIFENCVDVTSFDYAFYNCTKLTTIPAELFANNTAVTSFSGTFSSCSNLTTIGARAFKGCTCATNFSYCFDGCDNITTIEDEAFAECTSVTTGFNSLFSR